MAQKILFITTSHSDLGQTGHQTGIWAEELAMPYLTFTDAGYEIIIASPKGGPIPFDPASLQVDGHAKTCVERFFNHPAAQQQIQHSIRLADITPADYKAVFFPGGHGTMWDFPDNPYIKAIVENACAAQKVIAAVCHGVAALVDAKMPNGKSIVFEKRINSFTNEEEAAAGLTDIVPFKLETRLRELGGLFENGPNWQGYAVQDGFLITGQNPASSEKVAELVLTALNKTQK